MATNARLTPTAALGRRLHDACIWRVDTDAVRITMHAAQRELATVLRGIAAIVVPRARHCWSDTKADGRDAL